MEAGGASSSGNGRKGKACLGFRPIGLVVRRECAGTNLGSIGGGRLANLRSEIGVTLHEPWRALEQTQQVLGDEDLAVAFGRGADTDDWRRHAPGDIGRNLLEYAFDHDAERTSLIDGAGICGNLAGFGSLPPAGAIATKNVHCLGS